MRLLCLTHEIATGFWISDPSADQWLGRVIGLNPHTGQGDCFANGEGTNDFGHQILLLAQPSPGRRTTTRACAALPDIGLRRVGRAAGSCGDPGGFCSLARTGSRTVSSGHSDQLPLVAILTVTAQENTPASWRFYRSFGLHVVATTALEVSGFNRQPVYTIPTLDIVKENTQNERDSWRHLVKRSKSRAKPKGGPADRPGRLCVPLRAEPVHKKEWMPGRIGIPIPNTSTE